MCQKTISRHFHTYMKERFSQKNKQILFLYAYIYRYNSCILHTYCTTTTYLTKTHICRNITQTFLMYIRRSTKKFIAPYKAKIFSLKAFINNFVCYTRYSVFGNAFAYTPVKTYKINSYNQFVIYVQYARICTKNTILVIMLRNMVHNRPRISIFPYLCAHTYIGYIYKTCAENIGYLKII